MIDTVREMAEELPEHQSSRGNEFRNIPVDDRSGMAMWLVRARSQATAENADWDDILFIRHMAMKENRYYYEAGQLDVKLREAKAIWRSVVNNDQKS